MCVFAYVSSGLYEWYTKSYISNHLYMLDVLSRVIYVSEISFKTMMYYILPITHGGIWT